jgi:glycosyltransferase involved in cell wall biosynthesis
MKKISCIIPAYNEEPRIGNILKVLVNHPLIDEIIVVDDCSSDNTEKEALKFEGIKIVKHEKNLGKSRSMLDGCEIAKNDSVMFLDADLIGLTTDNITQIVKPVLDGLVDMTMTICNYDFILNSFSKLLGVEIPNGERVIKKEIAKKILKNATGYSIEIQMNQHFLEYNLKFIVISWLNVAAPSKRKKNGLEGIFLTFIGLKQLITNVSISQIIKQMLVMGKLSARYKKELNIGP